MNFRIIIAVLYITYSMLSTFNLTDARYVYSRKSLDINNKPAPIQSDNKVFIKKVTDESVSIWNSIKGYFVSVSTDVSPAVNNLFDKLTSLHTVVNVKCNTEGLQLVERCHIVNH